MIEIKELSEYLNGTAQSLDDAIKSLWPNESGVDILSIEQTKELDELVFKCEVCDWWYDIYDIRNNMCIHCFYDDSYTS